jgi:uncharacterized protein (DUF427 family)
MQTKGPVERIRLEPAARRWRARFGGHVIADTGQALILHEAGLPPVVYFPRQDVEMGFMGRTERRTRCPFKGEASYYTLTLDGEIAENVAWSYETPIDAVEPIRARIAFYSDRVKVYAAEAVAVDPRRRDEPGRLDRGEIDQIVLHTDAGDGRSQREHWPSPLETPDPPEGGASARRR